MEENKDLSFEAFVKGDIETVTKIMAASKKRDEEYIAQKNANNSKNDDTLNKMF